MVDKISVHIAPFGEDRDVYLYLPDDWQKLNKPMPVLYMFDGQNLFFDEDAGFGRSWRLEQYMKRWGRKMIIAALAADCRGENRLLEYCPYPIQEENNSRDCCGEALVNWIADELKPMVDRELPALAGREHTAIAGSSCGAIMALYAFMHRGDVFSRAACLSTAYNTCWQQLKRDIPHAAPRRGDRLFMSWGNREVTEESVDFLASATLRCTHILGEKGARVYPYMQLGGKHNEESWSRLLPTFMPWLMK